MLPALSLMIEACANLSNIALRTFLLYSGVCFRKISWMNFLLNIVLAMSLRTEMKQAMTSLQGMAGLN